MPKYNSYLHQACENVPPMEFSDKPLNVHGVRYHFRWPISNQYRKYFRASHARVRQHGDERKINRDYLRHMMQQRGLASMDEAAAQLMATGSLAYRL